MREVLLSMDELEKYEIIKRLVDNNGNKKNAAAHIGCTLRTVNRLILKYTCHGKSGFVHGNRGRAPVSKFDDAVKTKVIHLYLTKYAGCNVTHFCELLKDVENIVVSDTTVRNWLLEKNILSPKATRNTRRVVKAKLKAEMTATTSKKARCKLQDAIDSLDHSQAHPRHPRATYMGELIQMDASEFIWFGDVKTHLHVAIDDASGQIVGAHFDTQETLKGYYHVLYMILMNHGIPVKFLTDRRTVFEYKKKNAPSDAEDTYTQFAYACKQLGIDIETSSVPESKGRVERLNQTLQSRLPIELRLANVSTLEEANQFLKQFITKFNDQFSLPLNDTKNAFEVQPSKEKINQTLAVIDYRVIDAGHSIKYKKDFYSIHNQKAEQVFFRKGTKAMIIECFDGSVYVNVKDSLYVINKIESHYEYSKELDLVQEQPEKKPRKVTIPAINHPWRNASFTNFKAKQIHRFDAND